MLVLARGLNQVVMIGDDIKITVVGIRGNKVRLGVDAPKGISIHREEIWEQIQEAKKRKTKAEAFSRLPPSQRLAG